MNKKRFLKILIGIIIVLFCIYILSVVYKYTVLKNIQSAIIELNKNNNNYKLTSNGATTYYKDGIIKFTSTRDEDDWIWTDGKKAYYHMNNEFRDYTEEIKEYPINKFIYRMKIDEPIKLAEELNIFKLALNPFNIVSIKSMKDEVTGTTKKCIKVQYGNTEEVYFDKETKEPLIRTYDGVTECFNFNIEGYNVNNEISRNCVKDEDVLISEDLKLLNN